VKTRFQAFAFGKFNLYRYNLEDYLCDLPKADQHLASLVAGPIADGHVSFGDLAEMAKLAGPDDEVGLYKLNAVHRELESAWLQPLEPEM
jgi:hypothetical protein